MKWVQIESFCNQFGASTVITRSQCLMRYPRVLMVAKMVLVVSKIGDGVYVGDGKSKV
jgi:hypothetical protein